MQLSCTITPTAPRSYQGLSIQANVRGSKLLKLPLIAEAVVPELEVAAPPDRRGVGRTVEPARCCWGCDGHL